MLNIKFGLDDARDELGRPYITFHMATLHKPKEKEVKESIEKLIRERFPNTVEFHLRDYETYTDDRDAYHVLVRISGDN